MNKEKRAKLERAGFKVGTVQDFLNLTDADMELIEMRRHLAALIRARRQKRRLSQLEFAKRLKSAQPRIVRMEAAASDVSLDFMFRAAFVLGIKPSELLKLSSSTKTTLSPKASASGRTARRAA